MDIRIREPLYILHQDREYIVRPGTVGIERNKVVFFYDVTRTASVGYSREYCLENPQTFQVSRTLADKEISLKDIGKVLEEFPYMGEKEKKVLMELLNRA